MKKVKLDVAIHCASCVINIEKVLKKSTISVEANPLLKVCNIEFDETKTTIEKIIKKIKGIGYDAKEA